MRTSVAASRKAAAQCIAAILANVAAIGIAFALYDGRGWCLILSMLATVSAASIAWRAAQYGD